MHGPPLPAIPPPVGAPRLLYPRDCLPSVILLADHECNPPQEPRPPLPQWKCVFDQVHCEWMESVQLVFDYFCERTPRSFVEARETSLVWNYKYADVEFGRIQVRSTAAVLVRNGLLVAWQLSSLRVDGAGQGPAVTRPVDTRILSDGHIHPPASPGWVRLPAPLCEQ